MREKYEKKVKKQPKIIFQLSVQRRRKNARLVVYTNKHLRKTRESSETVEYHGNDNNNNKSEETIAIEIDGTTTTNNNNNNNKKRR